MNVVDENMKVHSAIVKLVLRTNKLLANHQHPIMIRVNYGYMREKSTGYSCDVAHWDKKNQLVKKDFKNAALINAVITGYKDKVVKRKLQFEIKGDHYTPEMLLDNLMEDAGNESHVFSDVMERMVRERKLRQSTINHYRYACTQLANTMGTPRFLVDNVTETKMMSLIEQMRRTVSEGTIHAVCANIAAVCNYAIDNGLIKSENYCFRRLKYAKKVRRANKTAYIDKDNLVRIEQYYLDLVTEPDATEGWRFREGAVERIRDRRTVEFALAFWLAVLKLNGSAPIDVTLLKEENFSTRRLTDRNGVGKEYYCFDFKRAKTGVPVRPRVECNRLARAIFEPFVHSARCRDGYIFPIVQNDRHSLKANRTYESIQAAVRHVAHATLLKMRKVCGEINEKVMELNKATGRQRPLINLEQLSCYNMRHSFAMAYLSTPGANINALASLMARSPNNIGTYITQLQHDQDLIDSVADMGI